MTGLEIAILGLGAYSLVGVAYANAQKDRWSKEIKMVRGPTRLLELYCYKTVHDSPVYIGSGNDIHAMIPVGGGSSEEKVFITSRIANMTDYKHLERGESPIKTYAHNLDKLKSDLKCDINLSHYRFSFPVECNLYKYPRGAFYHKGIGRVAESHAALLEEVTWRRRLPGTMFACCASLVLLGIPWAIWWLEGGTMMDRYRQWYPPFWVGKRRIW